MRDVCLSKTSLFNACRFSDSRLTTNKDDASACPRRLPQVCPPTHQIITNLLLACFAKTGVDARKDARCVLCWTSGIQGWTCEVKSCCETSKLGISVPVFVLCRPDLEPPRNSS